MPDHNAPAPEDETPPPRIKAEDNVWYRLATVTDDHEENRRLWNGYMGWWLSSEQKAKIKDYNSEPVVFPELSYQEKKRIRARLGNTDWPDPRGRIEVSEYDIKSISRVDFSNTDLPGRVNFSGFIFPDRSTFTNAIFNRGLGFFNSADFTHAIFSNDVSFVNATFEGSATFMLATFNGPINFSNATFVENALFTSAIFIDGAYFNNARFSDKANFDVRGNVYGNELKDGEHSALDFSNAKFGGETDFRGRYFINPPRFFEAELHEHTYFDDDIKLWPAVPKTKREAETHIKAYQRLARLMNLQKKHEDWHFFNRLEMRARRVKEGHWSLYSLGNRSYQLFAGYSYGLINTTAFWVGHMLLGAGLLSFPYLPYFGGDGLSWEVAGAAFTKSFINAHPFLLDLKAEGWADRALCTQCGGEAVEVLQTVFGPIFLFFLFLTLCNRFRF